jgi:glycosyltransferase involved in cell wall biosynthesis
MEAVDGIQRAALDLCRGLAEEDVEATILTLGAGNNAGAWEEVAEVRPPAPFLACAPRAPLAALRSRRLARLLGRRFDVVVAHRLDLLNGGALIAAHCRAPLAFHAHNGPPPWLQWNDLLRVPGSRRVSRLIVASRFMAAEWKPTVGELPIDVVELPIDVEHFDLASEDERTAARAELGVVAQEFAIAYVGRLEEAKGPHVLAAAARRLHDEGHAPHLLVQGSAGLGVSLAEAAEYRRRCEDALGRCPVTWVPAGPEVDRIFQAGDVCVVPSVWAEPSGLVVSEALATGTPVIASAVGGIPEQLPKSSRAALVPPEDTEALSAALRGFLDNPPDESERQRLRAHVEASRRPSDASGRYRAALGI